VPAITIAANPAKHLFFIILLLLSVVYHKLYYFYKKLSLRNLEFAILFEENKKKREFK